MNIIINGETKEIPKEMTIKELIEYLNYSQKGFAVALNETFVPTANYETTKIKENSSIEILAPVQGG